MSDDDRNRYQRSYATARILLESGDIDTFKAIFQIITKAPILELLAINERELQDRIDDPRLFQLGHVWRIAELLEVDPVILIEIIHKYDKRSF